MRKLSLVLVLVFFMMVGSASAATVELSFSSVEPDGTGILMIAYTGAVDSIVWTNFTGYSIPTIPLNGNNFVYEAGFYIPCGETVTAEMYTGAALVATDSFQRTDSGCNIPSVSFSQYIYECDSTIQINYQYAQNSTINIHELENYGDPLWTTSNVNGSGALYPDLSFTAGFEYLVEIQTSEGSGITFDTMLVTLCGVYGDDPANPPSDGGGTGEGDTTDGGTDSGGAGSDGGTDPFTAPNSYDPAVPGQEWKQLLDLNNDGVNSYAESIAAFRYWGFTFLFSSYGMALFKFVLGVKLW